MQRLHSFTSDFIFVACTPMQNPHHTNDIDSISSIIHNGHNLCFDNGAYVLIITSSTA